jgi:hypothetical protein
MDQPEGRYSLIRPATGGWQSTFQPFFSGGGSVIAVAPFQRLPVPVASLAGGTYWFDLGVYDYGTAGLNIVLVRLNGVEAELSWGGGAGPAGVQHIVTALAAVPPGAELTIEVRSAGQEALIIDSVTLVDTSRGLLGKR